MQLLLLRTATATIAAATTAFTAIATGSDNHDILLPVPLLSHCCFYD